MSEDNGFDPYPSSRTDLKGSLKTVGVRKGGTPGLQPVSFIPSGCISQGDGLGEAICQLNVSLIDLWICMECKHFTSQGAADQERRKEVGGRGKGGRKSALRQRGSLGE